MAYMKRKGRHRRILLIIVAMILLLAIAIIAGYGLCTHFVVKELKTTVNDQTELIDSSTKHVYVASNEIKTGELITIQQVIDSQMLLSDQEYITPEDLEAVALVDIPQGCPITKTMITKESIANDTREVEFTAVTLMTNLAQNDVVDIRILFPNGEDYLVLSKKKVRTIALSSNLFYSWISEEEIQRMSSAVVDAYLHKGSKLYAVKYIEPVIQQEAIPTYLVRQEVMDLIRTNPNIVKVAESTLSKAARESLEIRLAAMKEVDMSNVESNLSEEEGSRNSVILAESNKIETEVQTTPSP